LDPAIPRYTVTAIALHWLTAALIITLVGLGWYLGALPPRSSQKPFLLGLHESLGILAAALIAARITWRAVHAPPPLPDALPRWERTAARFAHMLLYFCIIVMPLTGYVSVNFTRGPVSFFGLDLPVWAAPDRPLQKLFEDIHVATSNVLVALVALHAAAALKYWLYDRNGVFQRMLPGCRAAARP